MNLADYNIGGDNPQSILMVGESGTGKSIAAAYWPKPLYFASCDGRMGSVAEWHRGEKQIDFDIFTDYQSLHEKIEAFQNHCPYKTIIIDPLTNISSGLMRYSFSLRGMIEYNQETGQVEKKSKGKKKGLVDMATYEDIGVEHRGIEDMILNMKLIQKVHGCNIILTAHLLKTQYTKLGGQDSHIKFDIVTAGKKIVPFIPTQFDEYYNFTVESGRWIVKTYNDGMVQARSSFLLMPKEIDWTEKNFYELVSKYYIPSEKSSSNE